MILTTDGTDLHRFSRGEELVIFLHLRNLFNQWSNLLCSHFSF